MPALSTTRPLVLVCLLTNELLNKLNLNLEPPWEARFLKRKPSEYMTSDEFFYALNWRNLLSLVYSAHRRTDALGHLVAKHGENVQGKRECFGVSQTADQEDAAQPSFIAREKGVLSYDG